MQPQPPPRYHHFISSHHHHIHAYSNHPNTTNPSTTPAERDHHRTRDHVEVARVEHVPLSCLADSLIESTTADLGLGLEHLVHVDVSRTKEAADTVLYWLSGLTCTYENFIIKSGAQRTASSEGVALIATDTSPRGLNIKGESDSYDFGVGAVFYLNATQEKWKNWQMYDYIMKELPALLRENSPQLVGFM